MHTPRRLSCPRACGLVCAKSSTLSAPKNDEAREGTMPDKERVYSEEEVAARLEKDLPHWKFENGWIRRKYKTHSWKGTLMVINTVGHLAEAACREPSWGYAKLPRSRCAIRGRPIPTRISLR